ncbi:hypothetical protein [Tessaracoccus coleopterorum]|uniref:hypothetical protein n=1 Tax=Tessaracoccus coleopterorum TaxID=2714950 RepID=UPI0018D3A26B|nr:hypothetical protein [Tessaracoccus coleopterorum]
MRATTSTSSTPTSAPGRPHYVELEKYVATLGDAFDLGAAFEGGSAATRRPSTCSDSSRSRTATA